MKILRPGHMNVTARGLRYGGLQETAVRGQEDAGVYHGGWNKKSNNARFYMKHCYRLLTIGSQAISGYPNPERRVRPTSCEAFLSSFNQSDRQKFQKFLATIIKLRYNIVLDCNHLHMRCLHHSFVGCRNLIELVRMIIAPCNF